MMSRLALIMVAAPFMLLLCAAKAIQTAFYGRPPVHSYWAGRSDGGREGLLAQSPRFRRNRRGRFSQSPDLQPPLMAWALRANTDANGQPILTADKLEALHAAVVKACDANDGLVGDGLIGDPRDCGFEPATIQCKDGDHPDCLPLHRSVSSTSSTRVISTPKAGV